MPSAEYDLVFLEEGVSELKSYLLSKELYWSLGANSPPGEPSFPTFTLGWLLFSKKRIQAYSLTAEQTERKEEVLRELELIQSRWRSAWEKKAEREFEARLKLWTNFINEYRKNKKVNASRYSYEVQRRIMLALLKANSGEIEEELLDLLDSADSFLRSELIPGEFVWEKTLRRAFPKKKYWYLYGTLRQE